MGNINMTRSQKNLDWVKSKFASLKANIHTQGISIHTANTQNQADPYICLRLVPNSRFSDTPKHRTQTQRRTWTDLCRIFHRYRSLSQGPKILNQIWCWPLT